KVAHVDVVLVSHADLRAPTPGKAGPSEDFTTPAFAQRLADLDRAAGQAPLPAVGALLEQEPATPIEDHGGDAGADSERPGNVGLERDHELAGKSRPKSFQAIGAGAATPAFSSAGAPVFLPTSAVPTPGVERTNWSARLASVLKPGRNSVS